MNPNEIEDIFSNTSEYDAWTYRNCRRCTKSSVISSNDSPHCEIDEAIFMNACGEAMPINTAKRMGYDDKPMWVTRNLCTELESKEG